MTLERAIDGLGRLRGPDLEAVEEAIRLLDRGEAASRRSTATTGSSTSG